MDIEKMRIRMGEMAAEIERLNSAWQVQALNRKDLIAKQESENDRLKAENARLQSENDQFGKALNGEIILCDSLRTENARLQSIIDAQQSPDYAALRKWYVNLTNADNVQDGINVNGKHCTDAMIDDLECILEQQSPVAKSDEFPFVPWSKEKDFFGSMQQSPGVAVPIGFASNSSMAVFSSGNSEGVVIYRTKTDERSIPVFAQSPRITEQDDNHDYEIRLEVYEKARDYVDSYEKSTGYPPSVDLMFQNFNALCNLIHTYRVTEQDALEILEGFCKFGHYSSEIGDFLGDSDCRDILAKLNKHESVGG